jgi:hypothetical protein
MMKYLYLLILALAGVCPAVGQEETVLVSGYVTDSETGERMSGVHLRVGASQTVSNDYGFYSLRTPAGSVTLRASYTGYAVYEETRLLQEDAVVSIALKPGVELSEVLVTARPVRDVEDRGLGNMRVNLSQLSVSPLFLGERDIIKTMQFLPGVSSGMEGSSNLNIRGGTNDQTLYLMDDVPVYNQNHTFGLISIFNPDALLGADIYKGGLPAVYGNRLSGVASVALKDGNMKAHRQSVSVGLLAGTLSAEGPLVKEKASYLFTARRSFIDLLYLGFMSLAGEGEISGALISFWDLNGKLTWKTSDKTRLSLSVYNGKDDLGGMNKTKDSWSNQTTVEKMGLGWMTTTASLRLTSNLSPNRFLSSSLYYSQLDNFDYYNIKTNEFKIKQRKTSRLQEAGWRASLENKLSNIQTLVTGLDASLQYYLPDYLIRQKNRSAERFKNGSKNLATVSVFAYDRMNLGRWTFVPGLRASFYHTDTQNKLALEPRVKLSTFVNDYNKLMIAYDRTTQPVHSVNEMNYSVQTDYWLPFNENHLPVSDQLSVGWKNYAVGNLTLSVEGYYKKMRNLIMITDLENYMDFHTHYQTGTGRSMGVEFMTQYNLRRFNTWLSYTLSKSERTFGGRTSPFKYDAPHDVSLFAGYTVRQKGDIKNSISVNMQYRSGLPYYVAELSYPSMPQGNLVPSSYTWYESEINYIPNYPNTRIRDFFRTDLNFTMEKRIGKGLRSWQFSLLNVTGHENPYNLYRKNGRYKAFLLIPFLPSFSFKREF